MKILMVGNMHPMYQPIHYAHAFEERGDTVIKLATDSIRDDNVYQMHVTDGMSNIAKQNLFYNVYAVDMKRIINRFDPELIFMFQTPTMFNFKGVDTKTIPVYFYAKNSYCLTLPRFCNIEGMFYAWPNGRDMYEIHYPWLMRNAKTHEYIPCGWSPSFHKNTNIKREVFIGFMGNHSVKDGVRSDILDIKNLYANRLKYTGQINKTNRKGVMILPQHTVDRYMSFMNQVSIALNVPANYGDVNERSFHSMGMGCVSLHYDNGNLYKYGFIDKVNSLLFKDIDELEDQIFFAMKNPSEIEAIRKNGIKFANKHTFKKRAEEIRLTINNGFSR